MKPCFASSSLCAPTTIRQPRATQHYRVRKREKDAALAAELRRISAAHPRAGYRMATALLRRAGMEINAKVLGKRHRHWHKQKRPHWSLDDQTPAECAQGSHAAASATLRQPHGCAHPTDQISTNPNPENQQKLS